MPRPFQAKILSQDQKDMTSELNKKVQEITDRITTQNALLSQGNLDAPYIPYAISLGHENISKAPIYKINVPGYFYRQHYQGAYQQKHLCAMFVANSPNNLMQKSNIMLYTAGSNQSGQTGNVNNMTPILPGSSTYAYFVRDTSVNTNELVFVPAVIAVGPNISPTDYVTEVGEMTASSQPTGASGSVASLGPSIFSGNWRENWRAMCSWCVLDERKNNVISFVDETARKAFVKKRCDWIRENGCDPTRYGYTEAV